MGTDPARSVVNECGRSHGVKNLFIFGGGIFVTSAGANPTWTIQAPLYVADSIKQRLAAYSIEVNAAYEVAPAAAANRSLRRSGSAPALQEARGVCQRMVAQPLATAGDRRGPAMGGNATFPNCPAWGAPGLKWSFAA
jgi:GMC oxidoreductase